MRRVWLLGGASLLLALALTASALAETPAGGVYAGQGGNVQSQVERTGAAGAAGALPFTGLDLVLLVLGGGLLLAAGLTIRRVARAKTTSS